MKDETKRFIEDLTGRIVKYYGIKIPVQDIREIVKNMGGTVIDDPALLPYDDTVVQKTGDKSFVIRIPRKQRKTDKPLLIAEGIGHVFLHMGFETCRELWEKQESGKDMVFDNVFTESGFLRIEQARYFAMSLLMPKDMFIDAIYKYEENGRVPIGKIAEEFNVTISEASIWGKELGYLSAL